MSAPINDGGPAFPNIKRLTSAGAPDYSVVSGGGMTLRDYFAGQALAGLCANQSAILFPHPTACPMPIEIEHRGLNMTPALFADMSYQLADAMIAARGGSK